MEKSILVCNKIRKNFRIGDRDFEVLQGINLEVFEGELVALMGKSGSGKTTLLNIIGGLIEPTDGNVIVKGINVFTQTKAKRAEFRREKIGWVFQDFNLIDNLTALENVMVPILLSGREDAAETAMKALSEVGLEERAEHFPEHLSGGERQRVSIARAIANQPSLILADEPTGNLDTRTGDEIMQIFFQYKNQGKALLMVTHDKNLASRADRIFFLKNGQLLEITHKINDVVV